MKETITTTWQILLPGPLPPWLVLLFAVAAVAAVSWLLNRELRRRRVRGAARWLHAIRALEVVLVALLVAQPVLFLRRIVSRPAAVRVLIDASGSMGRHDAWAGTELFDLALASGEQFTGRETRPFEAAVLLDAATLRLQQGLAAVRPLRDQVEQGLPWGESLSAALNAEATYTARLREHLKNQAAALARVEAQMRQERAPGAVAPKENQASLPPFYPEPFAAMDAATVATDALAERLSTGRERILSLAQMVELVRVFQKAVDTAAAAAVAVRQLQAKCDNLFWARLDPARQGQLAALARAPRRDLVHRAFTQLVAQHPEFPPELATVNTTAVQPLPATDLYVDLADLLHGDLATRQISGVVLFSDGGQNLPERPDVLRHLRQRGVPLFTIGVGREDGGADVAIMDYRVPGMVQARREFPLTVCLKTAVPKDTAIELTLRAGDEVAAKRTLQADGLPDVTVTLSVRAPAEDAGLWTLTARTPEPDAAPDNDTVCFPLRVVRREERVLFVGAAPRWDSVHLMRALQRLPVRVDTVWWGGLKAGEAVERGSGSGRMPDTASRLERYALVVLDGPAFPGMSADDVKLCRDYLAGGGNLLLTQDEQGRSCFDRFGAASGATLQSAALLPATAPPLPAVAASADPSRTLSLWRQMAAPLCVAAAPAGDVSLLTGAEQRPCFTLTFSGRGKLYRLSVGDLFRLREWDGGPAGSRFLAALAVDLLTPLTGAESSGPALYPPLPLPGGDCWVVQPPGAPAGWSLLEPGTGSVLATLPAAAADAPAVLHVSLPWVERLQLRGPDKTRDILLARSVAAEGLVLGLDAACLGRMAKAADGAYLPLPRLGELPGRVQLKTDRQVTFRQVRLWNLPAILSLLALLFTGDWVLRRRAGLVL